MFITPRRYAPYCVMLMCGRWSWLAGEYEYRYEETIGMD